MNFNNYYKLVLIILKSSVVVAGPGTFTRGDRQPTPQQGRGRDARGAPAPPRSPCAGNPESARGDPSEKSLEEQGHHDPEQCGKTQSQRQPSRSVKIPGLRGASSIRRNLGDPGHSCDSVSSCVHADQSRRSERVQVIACLNNGMGELFPSQFEPNGIVTIQVYNSLINAEF